ncbi:hypothetical protein [Vibrio sp. 10N.261.46.A3]|uniref:hypothetical protein n=1 Tax=Vibrio sp. 10N.261.46.A3 TaxID=3229658 RepID=UPI00354B8966
MISKDKIWKYVNISDGIFVLCFVLGLVFFRGDVLNIAVLWVVVFISSGLGLRRYCKGKGMMRYGVIHNVDADDHDAILSSYYSHRWSMFLCTIGCVAFTIYQLWQSFI